MALMLNAVNAGRCQLSQVVSWMCEAPAQVWNIRNKGRIQQGYDADVVLIDMNLEQQILNENKITKCGWSPWHGVTLKGWPVRTFVNGETVFHNGQLVDSVRGKEAVYDR